MKNRVTVVLIIDFYELVLSSVSEASFKGFLLSFLFEKLQQILNYFIEYDLDSKGIANLAYYLEEEFKDKFEWLVDQRRLGNHRGEYRSFLRNCQRNKQKPGTVVFD